MSSKKDELLSAWAAFFVAHGLSIKEIEDDLRGKTPLSLEEYDVLLVLSRFPQGKTRLSNLASATVFTRSGITRITNRLGARGLLLREVCKEDRRGALATITPAGKEAMRSTWRLYSRAILSLLEPCFTENEAQQLSRLLQKVINRVRNDQLVQIKTRQTKH
jgi:DNA-binding MarR family transcriptional regulator